MTKSYSPLKRLLPYLRPHWKIILLSSLLALPLALIRFSPAPIVKRFTDDLLINKDESALLFFPIILCVLYSINFVVRFFHYYLIRTVVGKVNQSIKNDLFNHLMGLSADYFTTKKNGALVSRAAFDPNFIDNAILGITVLIREPITFICLFVYAFYLNWKLSLICLVILPVLAWVFTATNRNEKRYIANLSEKNAQLFATLQECLSGIRVIKAFGLEKYSSKKHKENTEEYRKYYMKAAVIEEVSHPLVELLSNITIGIVLYFGGSLVLKDAISPGELMAFCATFALLMNPLRTMNTVNIHLSQAAGACQRIFEVFDWKPNQDFSANPTPIKSIKNKIEFVNVDFAYPDQKDKTILKNISFNLPKGKATALVGSSGSGKTSIAHLLPRIFDSTNGKILIDGTNIKDFCVKQLRNNIAIVSQDVFLFNDTVEENIRCGNLTATKDEVREAAQKAYALNFIENLSDGFNTVIGDRGVKLSGGERQRLSIARAFLKNASILILDEATSNLDTESEQALQIALVQLMQNKTTLMIAHRLSTIQYADEILVLKSGEIHERGRHHDLVAQKGEYTKFFNLGTIQ